MTCRRAEVGVKAVTQVGLCSFMTLELEPNCYISGGPGQSLQHRYWPIFALLIEIVLLGNNVKSTAACSHSLFVLLHQFGSGSIFIGHLLDKHKNENVSCGGVNWASCPKSFCRDVVRHVLVTLEEEGRLVSN